MNSNYIKKFSLLAIILVALGAGFLCFHEVQAAHGLSDNLRQVKTADNSAVYYLDHTRGLKKAYVSADAYLSYGNKWEDIKVVSASELSRFGDLNLVKTADSPAVFYIQDGKKALIRNEEEFLSHGFSWDNIVTVSAVDLAGYTEDTLDNIYNAGSIQVAGSTNSNGTLNVSLGAMSANGSVIPLGSVDNFIGSFNLKAYSDTVEVNKITANLSGIYPDNFISDIYLIIDNNYAEEYHGSISNREVNFYFNNKIAILPNSTKQINFYLDTRNIGATTENTTFNISLANANSVNANADIVGNFPLSSGQYSFGYADGYLGNVQATEQSLSRNLEVVIGSSNQELANFKLAETSGNEDVLISYLIFKNIGTARGSDLTDFVLKDEKGHKIAQVEKMDGQKLAFALGNYKIKDLDDATFRLFADVVGGNDKTINFQLYDIKVKGDRNGYGLNANINNINEELNITRKTVTVTSENLTSKDSAFADKEGTVLGVFKILNNNQNIEIERINITLDKNASAPQIVRQVYLADYETGEIFDTVNPQADGILNFDLNGEMIRGKKDMEVAVVAVEIPESAKQGDTYQTTFNSIVYSFGDNTYYTDNVNVRGGELAISKSNLYIYGSENEEDPIFIKGEDKVEIGRFYIEAAAGDDAVITSLTITKGNSASTATYDNGFSNLKLYINKKKIGSTISKPYSDTYEFNNFSYKLEAGERAEVHVYADTISDLKATSVQLMLTNLVARSYSSGTESVINGANAKGYNAIFGESSAEVEMISGGSVNPDQDDNLVATFKITNDGNEELELKYITVSTTGRGFSRSLGYKNLSIREEDTNKRIGKKTHPVSGANRIKLNYDIPAGEYRVFNIYVDANEDVVSESFSLYLTDVKAYGEESDIKANIVGDPTDSVIVNSQGTYVAVVDHNISDNNSNSTVQGEDYFIRPVSGGYVSFGFGADAGDGYQFGVHNGVDFVVSQRTDVYAVGSGVISYVFDGGYGDSASYIEIDHQNGFRTRYGHLYNIYINIGDEVSQGDLIALSGGKPDTYGAGSKTTGAHLHFDMKLNDQFVNPENYL